MRRSDLQAQDQREGQADEFSQPSELLQIPAANLNRTEPSAEDVRAALADIIESTAFRMSERGKQFLTFVVEYRLQKHAEPVKERTIGVSLFKRSVDYATGDDSVVRAQAREVRRRLEKYYSANSDVAVIIDLPLGSYAPSFRWATRKLEDLAATQPSPAPWNSPALLDQSPHLVPLTRRTSSRRNLLYFGTAILALGTLALFAVVKVARRAAPESTISQFWAPAFASPKPLLICLPKPIFYRPSAQLYKRSAQTPGEFDHEVDRMTQRPHLRPDDILHWGDMFEYHDFGVGEGDVKAAVGITKYFTHLGKDTEVKIGDGYTTEDLRNSPAVVVGAFDNRKALEITSNLHFAFIDDEKGIHIQEQGQAGRSWFTKHGAIGEDYGMMTRLVDSSTGQFVVVVAGVEASGSDAAADLVVHPEALEKALRSAPPDWPQKNLQIIVSTTVTDVVASPAKVVDIYVW